MGDDIRPYRLLIKELTLKRNESIEATEEYHEAVNELADSFPQLITGFDDVGNYQYRLGTFPLEDDGETARAGLSGSEGDGKAGFSLDNTLLREGEMALPFRLGKGAGDVSRFRFILAEGDDEASGTILQDIHGGAMPVGHGNRGGLFPDD